MRQREFGLALSVLHKHNPTMRRTLSFVVAFVLLMTGSGALAYLLFFAQGWQGWMVLAAAVVATVGAGWLWSDFVDAAPNDER